MPRYQHASDGGQTITLQNRHLRLDVHKRLTGWGWGEIFTAGGKFMAVLDHLGELLLRDREIPMRLEAEEATRSSGEFGERLTPSIISSPTCPRHPSSACATVWSNASFA